MQARFQMVPVVEVVVVVERVMLNIVDLDISFLAVWVFGKIEHSGSSIIERILNTIRTSANYTTTIFGYMYGHTY